MRRRTLALALLFLTVPLAGCASDAGPTPGQGPDALVATARQASAWIDTPAEARAAGYQPGAFCVPGEGVHWIKPDAVDTRVDPFEPEVVLFLPTSANVSDPDRQRFVGVEYVTITEGTRHNSSLDPPTVMGVAMDGPMPGHGPDGRWHAVLHVYVADGITSPPGFPAEHEGIECPAGTRPPGAEPAPPTGSAGRSGVLDAHTLDDCGGLTGETTHDHAELLVYLDSDEPFDFSPDRYQLAAREIHVEGGERDANGTIVHVHEARPSLDCFFDTLGWEVSTRSIVTDTGSVFTENETHRIRVTVDGALSGEGFGTPLHHGKHYVVSFGAADGPSRV